MIRDNTIGEVVERICGKCVHHKIVFGNTWTCTNDKSDNYILDTDYEDGCEDWEERKVKLTV